MAQIMEFILNLLLLRGKFLSTTAAGTLHEAFQKCCQFKRKISMEYNAATNMIYPFENMLEFINYSAAEYKCENCVVTRDIRSRLYEEFSKIQKQEGFNRVEEHLKTGTQLQNDYPATYYVESKQKTHDKKSEELAKSKHLEWRHQDTKSREKQNVKSREYIIDNLHAILKSQEFLFKNIIKLVTLLEKDTLPVGNRKLENIKYKLAACTDILSNSQSARNFSSIINNIIEEEITRCRFRHGERKTSAEISLKSLTPKGLGVVLEKQNLTKDKETQVEDKEIKKVKKNKKAKSIVYARKSNEVLNRENIDFEVKNYSDKFLKHVDPVKTSRHESENYEKVLERTNIEKENHKQLIEMNDEHFKQFEDELWHSSTSMKFMSLKDDHSNKCKCAFYNKRQFLAFESQLSQQIKQEREIENMAKLLSMNDRMFQIIERKLLFEEEGNQKSYIRSEVNEMKIEQQFQGSGSPSDVIKNKLPDSILAKIQNEVNRLIGCDEKDITSLLPEMPINVSVQFSEQKPNTENGQQLKCQNVQTGQSEISVPRVIEVKVVKEPEIQKNQNAENLKPKPPQRCEIPVSKIPDVKIKTQEIPSIKINDVTPKKEEINKGQTDQNLKNVPRSEILEKPSSKVVENVESKTKTVKKDQLNTLPKKSDIPSVPTIIEIKVVKQPEIKKSEAENLKPKPPRKCEIPIPKVPEIKIQPEGNSSSRINDVIPKKGEIKGPTDQNLKSVPQTEKPSSKVVESKTKTVAKINDVTPKKEETRGQTDQHVKSVPQSENLEKPSSKVVGNVEPKKDLPNTSLKKRNTYPKITISNIDKSEKLSLSGNSSPRRSKCAVTKTEKNSKKATGNESSGNENVGKLEYTNIKNENLIPSLPDGISLAIERNENVIKLKSKLSNFEKKSKIDVTKVLESTADQRGKQEVSPDETGKCKQKYKKPVEIPVLSGFTEYFFSRKKVTNEDNLRNSPQKFPNKISIRFVDNKTKNELMSKCKENKHLEKRNKIKVVCPKISSETPNKNKKEPLGNNSGKTAVNLLERIPAEKLKNVTETDGHFKEMKLEYGDMSIQTIPNKDGKLLTVHKSYWLKKQIETPEKFLSLVELKGEADLLHVNKKAFDELEKTIHTVKFFINNDGPPVKKPKLNVTKTKKINTKLLTTKVKNQSCDRNKKIDLSKGDGFNSKNSKTFVKVKGEFISKNNEDVNPIVSENKKGISLNGKRKTFLKTTSEVIKTKSLNTKALPDYKSETKSQYSLPETKNKPRLQMRRTTKTAIKKQQVLTIYPKIEKNHEEKKKPNICPLETEELKSIKAIQNEAKKCENQSMKEKEITSNMACSQSGNVTDSEYLTTSTTESEENIKNVPQSKNNLNTSQTNKINDIAPSDKIKSVKWEDTVNPNFR